jgi:hypothetical protein
VAAAVSRREAAIAAAERACPGCGMPRTRAQDYCVNCGLRLPAVTGTVASLRRGWLRRFGWYPGDWIWVGLPTLLVAIAGAAVAIALSDEGEPASATTTIVAPTTRLPQGGPAPVVPQTTELPTAPEPGAVATQRPSARRGPSQPNGRLMWPATVDGWTIVLVSYPITRGRAAPLATARRAARLGLPEVGVLESADFSSLHPGYTIVFSGIYSSRADAEAALTSARATGFGTAYTRQISR